MASVYVGHNPGLLHRQVEVRGKVFEYGETIGGESVRVYEFWIDGPRIIREATLPFVFAREPQDKRLAGLQIHISVTGSTPGDVARLWKYVSRVQRQP